MSQTRQDLAHTPRELVTYARTVSLVFFPDSERAVHVTEWGLATLLQVQDDCKEGSWKTAACVATVSKDGKWIICGCNDGKLRILDAESQVLTIETKDSHTRKVSALDVSPDSSTVASGSLDGSIVVWGVTTGQKLAPPLNLDTSKISAVQFSCCGGCLAACTIVGAVYILDIHDNRLTQRVVVTFNSRVTAFSWSNDVTGQQRIFTGLKDSLAVIDPSHGSASRKSIPGFRTLSRNGKFIVSGTWQDSVRFWDAATFVEIGPTLPSCLPLAISPKNCLVTVSWNTQHHNLSLWNLSDVLPKYYTSSDDDYPHFSSHTHSDSQALGSESDETFSIMLSKIQLSPNPEIHRQHQLYASPSQREVAEIIISDVLRQLPPVLIDTRTGYLCQGSLRMLTLEVDPIYRSLLPLISEQDQPRFRRGIETFFEYVMFSHKWHETYKEPLFHDILGKSVYHDLDRSPTNDKLRRFCELVRETGYRWAWSDTCCINRTDSFVLNKAIVSMYRWYERSALTLALLANMASSLGLKSLRYSIWMTRAWTLQELLAPRAIRFYDAEWKPYLNDPHHNHKDSPIIRAELASAISVDSKMLCAFRPGDLGVREKLRLASMRLSTVEEDIAYSLLGIFASDLQPKYGEGKDALGRLLEEIVHRSGDVTALAWVGSSSQFNSSLPAEITVYNEPPQTVSLSDVNRLRTRAVELQAMWSREAALAVYERIANLPKASFINRRLHLPCIAFSVNRIAVIINSSQWRVYRASVSVLGDVSIKTADPLPLRESRRLLLVHPWIGDLSNPFASFASDDYTRALWLIACLGQRFSALLFQQQPYHGYRRVAADFEIVVPLPKIRSPEDVHTEVLNVWNSYDVSL